jgi:hypothetical protein
MKSRMFKSISKDFTKQVHTSRARCLDTVVAITPLTPAHAARCIAHRIGDPVGTRTTSLFRGEFHGNNALHSQVFLCNTCASKLEKQQP